MAWDRQQTGVQLGKLLRIDVGEQAYHWPQKDNVAAIWLKEANALCWIENARQPKPSKVRNDDAHETYVTWHMRAPHGALQLDFEGTAKWARVGPVSRIDYASNREGKGWREYMHEVERGTSLYINELTSGERIWLCKGRLELTSRGLEN